MSRAAHDARALGTKPSTVAVLAFVATLGTTRLAVANLGIAGYSGKPSNGKSDNCATNCHTGGGARPTLTIDVPSALQAGTRADVSITVNGSNSRTSMNAALSNGVTATAGENTTVPFPQAPEEVTAVIPPPSGGSATYTFSFVAPNRNGSISLWVAGMAANGSSTFGDGVATAMRTITVSGATSSGSSDAGSSNDGSAPPDVETSTEDEDASTGSSRRRPLVQPSTGCAMTRTADPTHGAWIAVVGLVVTLRRRRQ